MLDRQLKMSFHCDITAKAINETVGWLFSDQKDLLSSVYMYIVKNI